MIEIKHLSKTFQMKDGAVNALKDISLTIPDGSIYGIIGMSGAGKSTLVRCINLLERPTEGSVVIDGVEMEFVYVLDTEAPVEIMIWLPQLKAFCTAEDMTHNMHNLQTLFCQRWITHDKPKHLLI